MTSWWCEYALLADGVAPSVSITARHGRISEAEPNTTAPEGATRLAGLTVPGFANAHSHAFHRALRSRVQAERGTFWTWRDTMYRAAQRLNPDNYYRLARAVFAEMTRAGISVVGEFHYVHNRPDGGSYDDPNAMGVALLAAADDASIRITLLDTLYLFDGMDEHQYRNPVNVQHRFSDLTGERWATRLADLRVSRTQRLGAAVHSARAVNPAGLSTAAEWAKDNNAPLHAHVSEQRAENETIRIMHGCTPTALLESVGVLDTTFTAVHGTHLTDHDIDLLGSSESSVCMCPTTERDLGDGIGPTRELTAAGVSLCVGSDSHAVIDQMVEARAVELHERLRSEQRGVHSAGELMHMATTAGHRSLGWDDAGAIAVGNRADLVTISLTTARTAGASTDLLLEAAVFASTESDITSVVIDGCQVASDGQHEHIDIAAELASSIEELLQ